MDDLEKMLLSNKPIQCEACQAKLFHIGGGKYKCENCENIVLDDFGKVKMFLEENGPSPAFLIAQATGVKEEIIELLLKKGQIEITEGSKYYLSCEKCGCSIRSGRFCTDCARTLAEGIKKAFFAEIGEKPKVDNSGKARMRFLDKR